MEPIKKYHADLENKKFIFSEIGLIISLLIIFFTFKIKTYDKNVDLFDKYSMTEVFEEMIPITVQEQKPIPPPPIKQRSVLKIVSDEVEIEEEVIIDVNANQETVIEEYHPQLESFEHEEEVIIEEPIFVVVESMPSFPGGMSVLMNYIQNNLKYPLMAKENDIHGKVFVSFVVEKDGKVSDVQVLRGIGGGCDEEAIRVVESMPNWIPGTQRNVPVRVRFNLPIKFVLQ